MRRRNIHQAALQLADVPGQERRPDDGLQEIEIQSAIMRLLRRHPAIAWAKRMNSGAGKLAYADGGKSRFIRFGFPGCPDIWAQLKDGGRLCCIEVKTATGTLTPEQAAFLALVNETGGVAFVARSVDDVITNLKRRVTT